MKKLISYLYGKYDNNLFLRIFYVLILAAPPALSTALKEPSVHEFIKKDLGFLLFLSLDKPLTILIIALWVPIITIFMHLLGFIAKKDYYYLNQQGTAALMASIEEIDAKKSDRLGKAVKNRITNKMEVQFNPEEQMKTIVEELYNFIKVANSTQNDVAVRLWRVENLKATDLIHYMPHTAARGLANKNLYEIESEFKRVIKRKRSLIIENSKKDKKFKIIEKCKDCEGCNLFTIPVIDDKTGNIYSVLQIRYKFTRINSPVYLNKTKENHLIVLEKFIRRLELEHRVHYLYKEKRYV